MVRGEWLAAAILLSAAAVQFSSVLPSPIPVPACPALRCAALLRIGCCILLLVCCSVLGGAWVRLPVLCLCWVCSKFCQFLLSIVLCFCPSIFFSPSSFFSTIPLSLLSSALKFTHLRLADPLSSSFSPAPLFPVACPRETHPTSTTASFDTNQSPLLTSKNVLSNPKEGSNCPSKAFGRLYTRSIQFLAACDTLFDLCSWVAVSSTQQLTSQFQPLLPQILQNTLLKSHYGHTPPCESYAILVGGFGTI